MKIAQITATFPPYMGGTGMVCYHNSLELAKLGHDVTVFTSYSGDSHNDSLQINVERFRPLFRFRNAPFTPQLLSKLKGFDIVHIHYPYYFGGELVYLASKLRGMKYVLTYHNDVIYGGFLHHIINIHSATIMRRIMDSAEKIFVTSMDYARNSFLKSIVDLDNLDKTIELTNGVDTYRFRPDIDGTEIRKSYGIDNEKIVLFVGTLDKAHYFKGIEYLLRAFRKIDGGSVLMIVGDGDLRDYYENLSHKLHISDKTIFIGKVLDDELPRYYAASDVVILPSVTQGEALGIVLLEAMATGKPVIASNLPGVRTVVDHYKDGILVEPRNSDKLASSIQYLLDNDGICKEFGRMGRRKVERKYSWSRIGKKLERIYMEVLC